MCARERRQNVRKETSGLGTWQSSFVSALDCYQRELESIPSSGILNKCAIVNIS